MEKNQQLTAKQEKLSNQIAEVGRLTELGFAKKTIEFDKVKTLLISESGREKLSFGLTMLFTRIPNLLGIKEGISDINKQDIKEMIISHYKTLSLEEIDYAFKLDRYSGEPIQHFQLFNAEYVAKVLKRYQVWLLNIRITNNLNISKLEAPTEPSPEEKKKIRTQFLKNTFEEVKENGFSDSAWLLYDDMESDGKILIGASKKKELYQKELNKAISEAKKGTDRGSIKDALKQLQGQNTAVKNRCKAILVSEYIQEYEFGVEKFINENL